MQESIYQASPPQAAQVCSRSGLSKAVLLHTRKKGESIAVVGVNQPCFNHNTYLVQVFPHHWSFVLTCRRASHRRHTAPEKPTSSGRTPRLFSAGVPPDEALLATENWTKTTTKEHTCYLYGRKHNSRRYVDMDIPEEPKVSWPIARSISMVVETYMRRAWGETAHGHETNQSRELPRTDVSFLQKLD